MALIVDASVAIKWLLDEDGSDRAQALVDEPLVAPDFLLLECANVLATKARARKITLDHADRSWTALLQVGVRVIPASPTLLEQARRMASTSERSAYDCLYLALALSEGSVLVTADQRFFNAMSIHAEYRAAMRLL